MGQARECVYDGVRPAESQQGAKDLGRVSSCRLALGYRNISYGSSIPEFELCLGAADPGIAILTRCHTGQRALAQKDCSNIPAVSLTMKAR